MRNKNLILAIIFVILVAASALLLYRGFSAQPITILPSRVNNEDVAIRNDIDALHIKLTRNLQKLEAKGDLDALVASKQFQELSTAGIRPLVVTEKGRDNPFIPVPRAGASQE